MALNNISFVLGQGGSGRVPAGQDFISGLVFYSASLPSGFSSSNRIKVIYAPADAEALGINYSYSDETKSEATYQVTAAGANADTVTLKVTEPVTGTVVNLGTYTKVAGDAAAADVATAIAAVINAGTVNHGYSAAAVTDTVTITARKGLGKGLDTGTPLSATYSASATLAGTITQFTGGVGSKIAVMRYHIDEFFRQQANVPLYVGIFAVPAGTYDFAEVATMQQYAEGKIRQFGVYKDLEAFATGNVQTLQAQLDTIVSQHKEAIAILAGDISGTADISSLSDLSTLDSELVSVVIGQDGANLGALLFASYGKSITTLGATLGAIAKAKVSESIAWVAKFNMSNGSELDTLAFANGVKYNDASVTEGLLSALQDKGYIFLRKFVGVAGSFHNENRTATALSSDYAYIADNRVIQKATRGMYASLIPALNSPIVLNSDGTLTDESIAYFSSLGETPLIQMVRDGDLSAQEVQISSVQNVVQTGELVVSAVLVPIGTARNIKVNIGFKLSI